MEALIDLIGRLKADATATDCELAWQIRHEACVLMREIHYQAAQDYLAEIWCSEYHKILYPPQLNRIPAATYVQTITQALEAVLNHITEGERQGMTLGAVILHDAICGEMMTQLEPSIVSVAQALDAYVEENIRGIWPPKKREKKFNAYVAKLKEVRSRDFEEGWFEDDSLAYSYLFSYGEFVCIEKKYNAK